MPDLNENEGGQPQFTELDRIKLAASHEEAAADAAEQAALHPEVERIDPAEQWARIPMMLGGLLAIGMPELRDVYTDKACYEWGGAMAMVAEKHGWDASRVVGPELALLAASVPLAIPTYFAFKVRRDAARQAEREKPINPDPQPVPPGPMGMEPGGFSVPT
jgi:hypothetical protein